MKLPAILPESFLRCLSTEDRQKLASGAYSAEEALRRAEIKSERDLQKVIVGLLRMKGIEPNVSRMDKRKTDAVGWPDVTFAVIAGFGIINSWDCACAWEIKFGDGQLSKEQQQMHVRLSTPPNYWRIKVIRSVDEALEELRKLGL